MPPPCPIPAHAHAPPRQQPLNALASRCTALPTRQLTRRRTPPPPASTMPRRTRHQPHRPNRQRSHARRRQLAALPLRRARERNTLYRYRASPHKHTRKRPATASPLAAERPPHHRRPPLRLSPPASATPRPPCELPRHIRTPASSRQPQAMASPRADTLRCLRARSITRAY
jgi:hypothetical protein